MPCVLQDRQNVRFICRRNTQISLSVITNIFTRLWQADEWRFDVYLKKRHVSFEWVVKGGYMEVEGGLDMEAKIWSTFLLEPARVPAILDVCGCRRCWEFVSIFQLTNKQ